MIRMERIALADFCGTIADYQTFNPFALYVLKHERRMLFMFHKAMKRCFQLAEKAASGIGYEQLYKKVLIYSLKGISQEKLTAYGKSYFHDVADRHLIQETMHLIQQMKNEGIRIIIVSAGCDLYIRPFAQKYQIYDVIATGLHFHNKKCTGKINGMDCIGKNKTALLERYFAKKLETSEFEAGISDSKSDMPMLALCRRKIIISKDVHQKWAGSGMEEIIWHSQKD